MNILLLKVGLILIPFYEIIFRIFPYVNTTAFNTRDTKSSMSLWLALIIGLYAVFSEQIKKCHNIWLYLLVIYIPISINLAPKISIMINGLDATNYWVWKPFLMIIGYFLLFLAVQSMDIKYDCKNIISIMVGCGGIMAVYAIFQAYGFDQFFDVKSGVYYDQVTQRQVAGTLGQPTIVSAFIAMLVPLALYRKNFVIALIMIAAVIVAKSSFSIGALFCSLCLYLILSFKNTGILIVCAIVSFMVICASITAKLDPIAFNSYKNTVFESNGRFEVWKNMVEFMKNKDVEGSPKGTAPFTGSGPGSFGPLVSVFTGTKFKQAHNEYLEFMCTFGIIGFLLFIMAIGRMLKFAFLQYLSSEDDGLNAALIACFFCIALNAIGSFCWQVSPHNFYTVVIAGLLHNKFILRENIND